MRRSSLLPPPRREIPDNFDRLGDGERGRRSPNGAWRVFPTRPTEAGKGGVETIPPAGPRSSPRHRQPSPSPQSAPSSVKTAQDSGGRARAPATDGPGRRRLAIRRRRPRGVRQQAGTHRHQHGHVDEERQDDHQPHGTHQHSSAAERFRSTARGQGLPTAPDDARESLASVVRQSIPRPTWGGRWACSPATVPPRPRCGPAGTPGRKRAPPCRCG